MTAWKLDTRIFPLVELTNDYENGIFTNGLGEDLAQQRNKLGYVDSLSPVVAIGFIRNE